MVSKDDYEALKNSYEWIKTMHERTLLSMEMRERDFVCKREAKLIDENAKLRDTLELIAKPKRPDGTYNRSREACEQLAREALEC